jgi:tRNA pseudouridine55 synthase
LPRALHDHVSGLLNLAKPAGRTSRDVVNVVQQLVKPRKVGHAGTLDPLATGVLVVCVGPATRLVPYIQDAPKTYRGTFQFGLTSDTDDITGQLQETGPLPTLTAAELERLLQEFVGTIEQVPPQVSAVHVDGRRAYALARKGKAFELSPRPVEIERLTLLSFEAATWSIEMVCGSGTYVRSLGRDVGARLGCGAVMTDLVRTAIGPFPLETAIDPATLTRDTWRDHLLPMTAAIPQLPRLCLTAADVEHLQHGRTFVPEQGSHDVVGSECALCDESGALLAIGTVMNPAGWVRPTVNFAAK